MLYYTRATRYAGGAPLEGADMELYLVFALGVIAGMVIALKLTHTTK